MSEAYLNSKPIEVYPITWYEKRKQPVSKKDIFFRAWLISGSDPVLEYNILDNIDEYATYNYKIGGLTFDEYKYLLYKGSAY